MDERVAKDTWVELHCIVLEPGERAAQVPEETRQVPLELKVKGFLLQDAILGEEAEIRTAAGRTVKGTLISIEPAYTHQFGKPIPELLSIGEEVRALLRERGIVQ